VRFAGTVYRAHNPRWSFAPLSGDGAARYGGRFNPVGVPALYTSRRMETAWYEVQQGFAFKAQPLTICAYEVDCTDVADLTDPDTLAMYGADAGILASPWEAIFLRGGKPPTWDLARRLIAGGIAAIIVPSFAPGALAADRNVVFYHWSDEWPHRVRLIDDEGRLPRDDRSWG